MKVRHYILWMLLAACSLLSSCGARPDRGLFPEEIKTNPLQVSLKVGESVVVEVVFKPATATERDYTLKILNKKIIRTEKYGSEDFKVIALADGETSIIVECVGLEYVLPVKILPNGGTPNPEPNPEPEPDPEPEPEPDLAKERQALVDLYNSTGGDNWTDNTNWLSDKPVGEWYGVSTNKQGYVIELNIVSNNLIGSLPESIGDLTYLNLLWLTAGDLTSSIPSTIGNLKNLKTLGLLGNELSGEIPESIGDLENLEYLQLAINQLSGSLPESICNLKKLEYLCVSSNDLTGPLPEHIEELENLTTLDVAYNQLEIDLSDLVEKLKLIKSFEELDLCENNVVVGPIPESISDIANLSVLNLSDLSLTGEIPASISKLTKLREFNLSFNDLTGMIPDSFSSLVDLEVFAVTYNQLVGEIPEFIGTMTKLKSLYLNYNDFTGTVPENFINLKKLERLYLNDNNLSGVISQELADFIETIEYNDVYSGNDITIAGQ